MSKSVKDYCNAVLLNSRDVPYSVIPVCEMEGARITIEILQRNRFRHFFVMELIILRYFCAIH